MTRAREFRKDHAEAARWYRMAAEQGYAKAQYNLGLMYAKGEGVPEDGVEAVRWYRMAAEQGHAKAQYNLGVMYAKGEGVPKDDVQAYAWLPTLPLHRVISRQKKESKPSVAT